MAAPTHAQTDVTALLGELNAGEQVIYFRADYPYNRSEQTLQKLVADCWSLSEVAAGYHEFIVSFRPLMALLREVDPAALTPLRCFQIKLLLIHFFRRVVLKDPLLPDALLPAQWGGPNRPQPVHQSLSAGRSRRDGVRQRAGGNHHRRPARAGRRLLSALRRPAARPYILRNSRYACVSD